MGQCVSRGQRDPYSFSRHYDAESIASSLGGYRKPLHGLHISSAHQLDLKELVVALFYFPANFLFNLLLRVIVWTRKGNPKLHDKKVKDIQKLASQWKNLPPNEEDFVYRSPFGFSISYFFKKYWFSIPLYDILEINQQSLTVKCEPMVTIGDITEYLIPKGYLLAVCVEKVHATLGDLAVSTGSSTHSHKVGFFHENIVSYDVILGDGRLVTVTADNQYSDLYKALPLSFGTLGFIVSLTLKIVRIKPYIKVKYIPVKGQKNYCDRIRTLSGVDEESNQERPDFIEGTIFSTNEAVIIVGNYSDFDCTVTLNHCSRWYKPWFYKHVESFQMKGESVELIPLRDYLRRHDRAIFWLVEDIISFGKNLLFRYLLGWLLPIKPEFLKINTAVPHCTFSKYVFQDVVLPIAELETQVDVISELFEKFPLLIYPCKLIDHGPSSGNFRPFSKYLVPESKYAMYNILGVYGISGKNKQGKQYNPVTAMRQLEEFARQVGGSSFLYADIFLTKKKLDLSLYEAVRKKYKADAAFPHLYDKVRPDTIEVFDMAETNFGEEHECLI